MKKILLCLFSILIFTQTSCEDEPIAISNISTADAITVNSDLYNQFEDITEADGITCIDFIYNFTLYIFDENLEFIDAVILENDEQFSAVLGGLSEGQSISVSYPITSMLSNGEIFEVTNNDQLKAAIDVCFLEEQLEDCQNVIVQEESCFWSVATSSGSDNLFVGGIFDVANDGTVAFYHETEAYFGTWIVYYIEDELHLNINLTDQDGVADYWNFDWQILAFADEQISLINDTNQINLTRNCDRACEAIFTACEDAINSESASFSLQDYIACIAPRDSENSPVHFSFYETEADAQNNMNMISPTDYMNIVNPQTIFARVENILTGELVEVLSFTIATEDCDQG